MFGKRKFSKISQVLLAVFFVAGVANESYSRGGISGSSSSKRAGASSSSRTSVRAGSSSSRTSSSKRAGASSSSKRSGSMTSSSRSISSRSGSRSSASSSSRTGSRSSSSSVRAATFFNSASTFNTVSAMVQASDPQTQAEAECITDYASCMDMLIPYVISQNPFLRDSAEVKYMQDADHDLRFVYDATAVSEDGTECDGKNCAEDSRASVLFRNYNYFCSEGGMSTARDCRNIGGTWNSDGYKCYDVSGTGYTGAYDGAKTSNKAYAKPDSRNNPKEFENWANEEATCKEYGGVWSQCMPKDNSVTSTSLKDLRRCYYDKESYLTQKGSRSSTAYYQELSKRLSLPAGDPNSLKVVDLSRTIISALGFKTDDMPKIGNSNYSFAVSVTPPATMLNASVSLAQMDDICFIARDGDDDKVDQRIRMKSKKLASESYYGELVDLIKQLASREYVDDNNKTHNNACKEIRGRLKKFYLTGISSVLVNDSDTCSAFLGDWSYCYNGDREKGEKEYYSKDGGSNGEEVCTARNGSWDTSKHGYCVWEKSDESVCELFGAEAILDTEGNFKSCNTSMKISNAGDCEGFGYYWNSKSGKCYTNDKYTTPIITHKITLGTDKNKRVEVFQVFDTPRKSSAKYEQALQAERLSWRSQASDYIMANAGKLENDIKRQEMADLLADAEMANELSMSQQELLEKCSEGLNSCIYKESICGENGANCISADGFQASKLSMVGLSCYPTYKKCVQNVVDTINKGASPFLSEYLQSFNGDMYWNLAKQSLAESLSEIYVEQLDESCKESGGYVSNEECIVPISTMIDEFDDGRINVGEKFECTYTYTVPEKKKVYWYDEFKAYSGKGWCSKDRKGDKNEEKLNGFTNAYPVNNTCSVSDNMKYLQDGVNLMGQKIPVSEEQLQKDGIDAGSLVDASSQTAAAKSSGGYCRVSGGTKLNGSYKLIDACKKRKRKKYEGYGRVYYSTIVEATSAPKTYELELGNGVQCNPGVFSPKGWDDFISVANGNTSAESSVELMGVTTLYCDALGGTKTVSPAYVKKDSVVACNTQSAVDGKAPEGCEENPIASKCVVPEFSPYYYMMSEIMEAMNMFDDTIDEDNSNRNVY